MKVNGVRLGSKYANDNKMKDRAANNLFWFTCVDILDFFSSPQPPPSQTQVLQMFRVMDHCLKRVGLDLKLTIYGCLATSPKSGIMEFVCAEDGSPSSVGCDFLLQQFLIM